MQMISDTLKSIKVKKKNKPPAGQFKLCNKHSMIKVGIVFLSYQYSLQSNASGGQAGCFGTA